MAEGVYLKYIDVSPDLKDTLNNYALTYGNSSLSTISLAELKQNQPEQINYATFEHNYWKLDGTYRGITGQSTLIWSDDVSYGNETHVWVEDTTLVMNNYGRSGFTRPPVLTRYWSGYQTSPGVYFIFYGPDFATTINIKWYRDSTLLYDRTYYPNTRTFFCEQRVELFNRCDITFITMSKVNRFLKVTDIWDGQLVEFYNENIRSLNILEELNPVSDELPMNVMELSFSHKIDDLNLVFQSKQVMEAYFNDELYGKFFISKSSGTYDISLHDYIGLIDLMPFRGGYYNNVTAGSIIDTILQNTDIPYVLDNYTRNFILKGIIKPCTKREALAQVLFATQSIADDSRSGTLNIYKNPETAKTVPVEKTFISGSNDLRDNPVTEVALTAHSYVLATDTSELFSSELTAGTYTIEFDEVIEPSTATISGGTFSTLTATYCIISVASPGTVIINAKIYEDNQVIRTVQNTIVPSGTPTNVISYTDKTLVSLSNADTVLAGLLAYHKRNNSYEAKIKFTNERLGDTVTITTNRGETRTGIATKLNYKLRKKQLGVLTEIVD